MIVADANLLIYAVVQSTHTQLAQEVARRDSEWVLPPLWRYEFTSAVVTMLRGRALDATQAQDAIREAERLVAGREMVVDQIVAFQTAVAFDISAYDAQYIALAQTLGVRCVTADGKLLRNTSKVAISMADFIA